MPKFDIHTVETAPEAAKPVIETVKKENGYVPNLIGILANAPTALETYRTVGAINRRTSLDATEREVVQITAAVINGCGFCVAGHTAIAYKLLKLPEELVNALREVAPIETDAKLNSLARFTVAVMENKGRVDEATFADFLSHGYTNEHALDVILGVSLATLCNYANNIADTPINKELQPYA
ncbi:MAG: carboxymuconolactone decarboxylase family protein [Gemella sp.]|nr:carboxymuconolactone decarboxylase family protein [Gemella sp.]